MEINHDVEIKIKCRECSESLDFSEDFHRGTIEIDLPPCEYCMGQLRNSSHDEGYEEGYEACQKENPPQTKE